MKVQYLVVLYFLSLFACSTSTVDTEKTNEEETEIKKNKFDKLVWSDEFDYSGFPDSTKWTYSVGDGCPELCGWGNNEFQYYTEKQKKNAWVADGILTIEVHEEKIGNSNFSSAKLITKDKGDWKYGKFEIRAKLPTGRGIWSAIWMMPTDTTIYGRWPKCGEIDIMENVGYDPDTIEASAHTGAYYFTIGTQKHDRQYLPDSDENFHTYILEWEEDQYRVYVDDIHYFTFQNEGKGFMEWPFDQNFYLILNIAYGGNWGAAKGLDTEKLPQKMEIDYVRVYE
ncbi:MAG: beta-glucanase (GH16 family) [Saprospiraceae bacterium]|jgi:beta-glucanase (GH16 family)